MNQIARSVVLSVKVNRGLTALVPDPKSPTVPSCSLIGSEEDPSQRVVQCVERQRILLPASCPI